MNERSVKAGPGRTHAFHNVPYSSPEARDQNRLHARRELLLYALCEHAFLRPLRFKSRLITLNKEHHTRLIYGNKVRLMKNSARLNIPVCPTIMSWVTLTTALARLSLTEEKDKGR
jgi:hypothetical protein